MSHLQINFHIVKKYFRHNYVFYVFFTISAGMYRPKYVNYQTFFFFLVGSLLLETSTFIDFLVISFSYRTYVKIADITNIIHFIYMLIN